MLEIHFLLIKKMEMFTSAKRPLEFHECSLNGGFEKIFYCIIYSSAFILRHICTDSIKSIQIDLKHASSKYKSSGNIS